MRAFPGDLTEGLLYPSEFSIQAKNRIEAEQIRAYQDFEEARRAARGDFETEPLLCQCILRVFLAFVLEACAFGRSRLFRCGRPSSSIFAPIRSRKRCSNPANTRSGMSSACS